MILKRWEDLPEFMRIPEVRPYWELLYKKRAQLVVKRIFDIIASSLILLILSPVYIVLAVAIKLDSKGPVFFRQTRITQYGRPYRIFKFRTMVDHAETMGSSVTVGNDRRITRVGAFIRKYRIDEFGQAIDVLRGTMTFVGTRPEVPKYVEQYAPEMLATLLLPAGITSLTSIYYKDEASLLEGAEDPDAAYVRDVLPGKMGWNLRGLREFNLLGDLKIMWMTVLAVCGKDYIEMDRPKLSEVAET